MIIISKKPILTGKVITTSPEGILNPSESSHNVGVRKTITKKGGVRTIKK